MKPEYQKYINNLKMTYEKAYGNCEKVCKKMNKQFPELIPIKGHYYCMVWGKRMHWWLETHDGTIIDPTAIQFPTKGYGVYDPWDNTQPEPTGKCPNCGEYCYEGEQVHRECHSAFIRSLME